MTNSHDATADQTDAKRPPENLGLVRTDLANERTLLAYGRTALMVVGTGVSLIEFFKESTLLRFIGWSLVLIGFAIGAIGVRRFARLNNRLHQDA